MSRLFETVCIMDGKVRNIDLHNSRLNYSRAKLFGRNDPIDLTEHIVLPAQFRTGKVKCRVEYSETVEFVGYEHYHKRTVRSLRMIEDDTVDYSHKYSDRSRLEELLGSKRNCDDILVVREGLVTDTSFSNIILFNGQEWHTPAKPLLRGIKREHLLERGLILEKDIRPYDLKLYLHVCLINAMLDPGDILFETAFIRA